MRSSAAREGRSSAAPKSSGREPGGRSSSRAPADRLRALSPKLVLERGYALVRGPGGTLVRSAEVLAQGARVTLEFVRGEADATVTTIRTDGTDKGGTR